jgi:hypothetical protein
LATAAIAILFLTMLAAPCVMALRSARDSDTADPIELPDMLEPEAATPVTAAGSAPAVLSLHQLAELAEQQAVAAQDLARETHWAALAAAARAARLRADAAAVFAEDALRAAQEARLRAGHTFNGSLDDPQSRPGRRAA